MYEMGLKGMNETVYKGVRYLRIKDGVERAVREEGISETGYNKWRSRMMKDTKYEGDLYIDTYMAYLKRNDIVVFGKEYKSKAQVFKEYGYSTQQYNKWLKNQDDEDNEKTIEKYLRMKMSKVREESEKGFMYDGVLVTCHNKFVKDFGKKYGVTIMKLRKWVSYTGLDITSVENVGIFLNYRNYVDNHRFDYKEEQDVVYGGKTYKSVKDVLKEDGLTQIQYNRWVAKTGKYYKKGMSNEEFVEVYNEFKNYVKDDILHNKENLRVEIDYQGKKYASAKKLVMAYGYSYVDLVNYRMLLNKEILTGKDFDEFREYRKQVENRVHLKINGKEYSSIADFLTKEGYTQSDYSIYLAKRREEKKEGKGKESGWKEETKEEKIKNFLKFMDERKKEELSKSIQYKGKVYKSKVDFCKDNNCKLTSFNWYLEKLKVRGYIKGLSDVTERMIEDFLNDTPTSLWERNISITYEGEKYETIKDLLEKLGETKSTYSLWVEKSGKGIRTEEDVNNFLVYANTKKTYTKHKKPA